MQTRHHHLSCSSSQVVNIYNLFSYLNLQWTPLDLQFSHQAVEGMSLDIYRNISQYNYNIAQFGRRIRDSCRNLKGRHCQNNKSAGAATLAHNPEDYTSLQLPNVSTAIIMMMILMMVMMMMIMMMMM